MMGGVIGSSGSSGVPVLSFLLFLKFPDFSRIEDLYFRLPFFVIPSKDVAGGDLHILRLYGGVIAEGDKVPG